jgi:hypothetical protein
MKNLCRLLLVVVILQMVNKVTKTIFKNNLKIHFGKLKVI